LLRLDPLRSSVNEPSREINETSFGLEGPMSKNEQNEQKLEKLSNLLFYKTNEKN